MNIIVILYVILYFLYIIFGPHFIRRLFNNDNLLIINNYSDIIKRSLYLSYITYIYNAYYFLNPTIESFLNSVFINTYSIVGYIINWYKLKNIDPYFLSGIITHCLSFLPILISVFFIKLPDKLIFSIQSKFTLFFLLLYILIQNFIYK